MTLIRCKCGRTLGRVEGGYEIICPKCGEMNKGKAA